MLHKPSIILSRFGAAVNLPLHLGYLSVFDDNDGMSQQESRARRACSRHHSREYDAPKRCVILPDLLPISLSTPRRPTPPTHSSSSLTTPLQRLKARYSRDVKLYCQNSTQLTKALFSTFWLGFSPWLLFSLSRFSGSRQNEYATLRHIVVYSISKLH